jgi:general secretion pathway protein G
MSPRLSEGHFDSGPERRASEPRRSVRAFNPPIDRPINRPIFRSAPIDYPITRLLDYPIDGSPHGFTLIELLVVLALISILATMGLAQYRTGVTHAKEAVLKTDLFDMRDAIDQYYADKGQYPSALDSLVSDGYLRKVPVDPFTNGTDSWQTVPSEPDPNNPTAAPGIYDVKSGSDASALDGTKYADW